MSERRRVLLMQPSMQPPGGGNGVSAWMAQALQDDFELSLLTLEPFQSDPVNRFYGTSLDPAKIRALRALPWLYPQMKRVKAPLALLKSSLLVRSLRRLDAHFDLVVSANNECDFGVRGIQYVHYPTYMRPRPDVDRRPYHVERVMDGYYGVCDRIAGVTRAGVKRNLTLVNSDWTGRLMSRWYDGAPTTTLYPPVAGDFPDVPWEARAPGFVCIGRVSPEKDLDRVFDILGAVRQRVPDLTLHLVGTHGDDPYSRHVMGRVAAESAWVTFHRDIPRAELVSLMTGHRYGIHAMGEEHFGMGVAEMVRAGAIVWTPDGGGQVEILDRDPRLLYRSDADAVDKIEATLASPTRQAELRERLAPQRARFSEAAFVDRFRAIVDGFFAERASTGAATAPASSPSERHRAIV